MVALGAKNWRIDRTMAPQNSCRSSALAACPRADIVILQQKQVVGTRRSCSCKSREFEEGSRGDNHEERDRQEHLPTQAHQLVVAVAWHESLHQCDHEEDEHDLQHEPNHARHPGEGCEVEWWQPSTKEQDGG